MIFDIRTYGAVGDGEALNSAAIQKAIDACHENGGGQVLISGGVYKTGSFIMKSNVDLHIAADGVLLGSENWQDYPEKTDLKHVISENLPRQRNAAMIFAEEAENISITGMGKIDCNGTNFVVKKTPEKWKSGWEFTRIDAPTPPRVVFFAGCRNVRVEDVTMVNLPSGWAYWVNDCDYVTFDKCKIFAEVRYPNNDGIHVNCCRNVNISNCDITCGDDCLIVRANDRALHERKISERITVTNCNLTSWSAAIRIGWSFDTAIRNCTFSNLVMTDTSVGISIMIVDKDSTSNTVGDQTAVYENLLFSNIVMDGIYGRPLHMALSQGACDCKSMQNIRFDNITCRGLEFPYLLGREDCKLKNIVFNNCSFEKVSDDKLPDYKHHGAAAWDRALDKPMMRYTENVVFNNTSFSSEV